MNAVAEFKDGKLHLYAGNQFLTRSTAIAASAVGHEARRCGDAPVLDRRRFRPQALRTSVFIPPSVAGKSCRQAGQGHLYLASTTC